MRALALALALTAAATLACGTAATTGDADAGVTVERKLIEVAGKAALHPAALAWLGAKKLAVPTLAGATVAAADPTRALQRLPPLAQATLGADLSFDLKNVDVTNVRLGLITEVVDAAGASGPVLDTGFGVARGQPQAALTAQTAWAVPSSFGEALDGAVGMRPGALLGDGYVLGMVRDAANAPVSGAVVINADNGEKLAECTSAPEPPCIWYVDATIAGLVTGGTSASGLFLLPYAGNPANYTARQASRVFPKKLAGSRADAVLVLFIDEGASD